MTNDRFIRLTDAISVGWHSADAAVGRYLGHLLAGWETAEPIPNPTIRLHIGVGELPTPPEAVPLFVDGRFAGASFGNLSVYAQGATPLLWFAEGGMAQLSAEGEPATAEILATPHMVASGRFEDILLVVLAYFLRRHGHYMVHAFGAAWQAEQGILLIGGSGSGKTTTGLNLITQGWQLLANDAPLLTERPSGVFALPTPGLVSIRPPTFGLLPRLLGVLGLAAVPQRQIWFAAARFGAAAPAVPIRKLFFPHITDQPTSHVEPLNRAVALAQLLEESVDRWDAATTNGHIALLERLTMQASVYTLHLGRNLAQIAELVARG